MASEWQTLTLRDAGVVLIDCDHRTPPAAATGHPYIAIPQLRDGRIDISDARRITLSDYVAWTRKAKPAAHDVVLSRRCNPGETSFVPNGLDFALGQNLVLLRADGTKVHPPFLRWLVRGPEWWEQIATFLNVGAVFDSLKCADIPNFTLRIPPLPEQRAIAHILGTLDDKIDLNRRMNATLEAMARALFKSWFVDFEPVRAKAEGRDPGLPEGVAGLFPDSFEDSALGEIPKGWGVARFGSGVEELRDKVNPLETPDEIFHHFSLPAYDDGQWPRAELGETIKSQKTRVPPGVILLSKLNPEIERVWLVDVDNSDSAVCSTEFLVLRPLESFGRGFVYCLCKSILFRQQIESLVTGTSNSHQRARPQVVLGLGVIHPSRQVLAAFEGSVSGLLNRALAARRESRTLATLRDTLLPKLISGELRVPDAERFVNEVA